MNNNKYEIIVFNNFWTLQDVRKMNDYLFIFGDNDIQKGKKGQAIIRDESNTIGVPTKKVPCNTLNSFYKDDEYEINIIKIDKAFNNIYETLKNNKSKYKGIVLPKKWIRYQFSKVKYICSKNFRLYK